MEENKEELDVEEVTDEVTETEEVTESAEEKLQKELDELNDKYLRLMSEYANYQTRTAKEKAAR